MNDVMMMMNECVYNTVTHFVALVRVSESYLHVSIYLLIYLFCMEVVEEVRSERGHGASRRGEGGASFCKPTRGG